MSKRALISVTDKSGVVEFARELNNLGYEVISTGNTFKILKENGVNAITIDEVTKFPEMLDGRVKTLNPYINLPHIHLLPDASTHHKEMKNLMWIL